MSNISLINASCADQTVDAVVNAANSGLWVGGGICGVIFTKAGRAALSAACSQYKTPLACLQYIVSNGHTGMPNAGKVFYEAYSLFQEDPETFRRIKTDFYSRFGTME